MLYLVSTPIGNLKDFTFRAVEVLRSVDLILCEDTRTSKILLNHYDIDKPLKSFHKFSEQKQIACLIDELLSGKNFALISDAGTPAISDPGEILVAACIENGINISTIPGASAVMTALPASSFSTAPFQFIGFIPKKQQERRSFLFNALLYPGTTAAYESPQRILETLEEVSHIDSERKVVVARELTKKFETFYRGTAKEVYDMLSQKPVKGEIVLIFANSPKFLDEWASVDSKILVGYCQKKLNLDKKEAIRLAADLTFKDRKAIYKELFL